MKCPKCHTEMHRDKCVNPHCRIAELEEENDRLKQELANLEDSFQTIARENNEFEKELAAERDRLAEAEKLHNEIIKQGMIGWVRQMSESYRAKYSKGGGDGLRKKI